MAGKEVKGEKSTEPYLVPGLLSGTSTGTWQEDYPLREVEFERIKKGKPKTHIWAHSVFFATLGFALSLLSKYYHDITAVKTGEKIALGAGLSVYLILCIIGHFFQGERKAIMKKIENHFKNAPTSRQAFREKPK